MFKDLIKWSQKEYGTLPWRKKRSLYTTLVSEIMLQQTTVGTVLNHFENFLVTYPNLKALSNCTEEEICISWKGLGYYRRARNLRQAAIDIEEKFKGRIPKDIEKLKTIKGIGDYTASALLSIGANKPAISVDANIERVLSRLFALEFDKGIKLQKEIRRLFDEGEILKDMEKFGPRNLNEAFMDLGRTICKANKADCLICPLSKKCQALKLKGALAYPIVDKKKAKTKMYELTLARFMVYRGDKILGYAKSEKEWLAGQIEIPTFILNSEDKALKQYPKLSKKIDIAEYDSLKTGITKYKIKNVVIPLKYKEFQALVGSSTKYKFFTSASQGGNFSTTTMKILKKWGK